MLQTLLDKVVIAVRVVAYSAKASTLFQAQAKVEAVFMTLINSGMPDVITEITEVRCIRSCFDYFDDIVAWLQNFLKAVVRCTSAYSALIWAAYSCGD